MRIIVNKMPTTRENCQYCENKSTMDYNKYICKFKGEHECYCIGDDMEYCPYFIDFLTVLHSYDDEIENMMEGRFKTIPYDNRL